MVNAGWQQTEQTTDIESAIDNLVLAYHEQLPGAVDAAVRFYSVLQARGMTKTELVKFRDLGLIAITEAHEAHLPGVEDEAAVLYAAILDDPSINVRELGKYSSLEKIANQLDVAAEVLTSLNGVVDGTSAFAEQLANTPYKLLSEARQGVEDIGSGRIAAVAIAAACNLAKDPLVVAKGLFQTWMDDGVNMNMAERHALAALYKMPAEARVEVLKSQMWKQTLNADFMLVGIPAGKKISESLIGELSGFRSLANENVRLGIQTADTPTAGSGFLNESVGQSNAAMPEVGVHQSLMENEVQTILVKTMPINASGKQATALGYKVLYSHELIELIAVVDNKIENVGFIKYEINKDASVYVRVYNIVPEWQGNKLSIHLFKAIMQEDGPVSIFSGELGYTNLHSYQQSGLDGTPWARVMRDIGYDAHLISPSMNEVRSTKIPDDEISPDNIRHSNDTNKARHDEIGLDL